MKSMRLTAIICALGASSIAQAETNNINLVFGISQPVFLGGGNIEVNYLTKNWVFEYSHGFNLDLNRSESLTLTDAERIQKLKIKVPYSTGGGIGYRFTPEFNLRMEFKQHKFEVTHNSGEKIDYTTRDLGIGAYYFYKPFDKHQFIVVPSIRYWPTIDTTLDNDEYTFSNNDKHKAHDFGLFTNISVGWKF